MLKSKNRNSGSRLPPGPPGKPLVGNTFDLDTARFQESLVDLGKNFEDVFTLKLGGENIVVVKSIQAYHELHLQDDLAEKVSGRPTRFVTTYLSEGKDLVLANDSPGFRQRRNICKAAIESFGESQEKLMLEEVGYVIDLLAKKIGEQQELDKPIYMFLTNLCMLLTMGRRLEYDDPMMDQILEKNACSQTLILPRVDAVLSMFPWLRHIPVGYGKVFQRFMQLSGELKEILYEQEKNPRGAIGDMLKLRERTEGETDSWLSDDHIWNSAQSVIGASTAPRAGDLLFLPIIILRQPEIGVNIQKEIDDVIGRDRQPTLADRVSMPYTEAVVLELLRYVSPVPTLVPRQTMEDVEFRDYLIPEGTTILTNAWQIHHDEGLWEEPWTFKPERFLDPSGSILPPTSEKRRNLIPFGSGSRRCPGGSLHMSAAFLFVTAVLQQFNFQVAPGGIPASDPRYNRLADSVPVRPNFYKIVLMSRV